MNTIDASVMAAATIAVAEEEERGYLKYITTVTVELNGQHGGADVKIVGFTGNDVSTYNERTVTKVVK